jgi:hypothetical protein
MYGVAGDKATDLDQLGRFLVMEGKIENGVCVDIDQTTRNVSDLYLDVIKTAEHTFEFERPPDFSECIIL